MRGPILAIIALVLRLPVAAQLVSVHEPGIRVAIPAGPASVTIPVDNPLGRASKGTLAVSWLDVAGKESPPLRREIELPRGRSEQVFTQPLRQPSIWTRLRYSLTPDRAAVRDFPPRSGIVSLAHVSPDVFEVKISYTHYSRGGAPFLVQAVATHPVTRQPVSDVQWSGTLEIDEREFRPSSIRNLGDGFAEIRFDPVAPADGNESGELTITARRGGFETKASAKPNFGPAITALIQTDKPIYQPGQTVRVRAVLTGPDGHHQAMVEAPQLSIVSLTSTHSVPWTAAAPPPSPDLRYKVEFSRLDPSVGANVRCKVHAERVGFRGYGMLIAEVGLPPGAEVDRASLENNAPGRYEILPDRVLFYLWPQAGGMSFGFDFAVRFPMTAKSAASVLYDYNNPEARATVPPSLWRVSR